MSILARLKNSLTARLLAVYLLTATVLIAIILISLIHGFARQWNINARPHLEQYLDFISDEIGNPPNAEKARQLADRLPVNIYIVGPDLQYSTNNESLNVEDDRFEEASHRFRNRSPKFGKGNLQFSGDEDRTLLKSTVGDYLVYYELSHRYRVHNRRSVVMPALLGAFFVLTLCFLVIKRLLRPVRDIRDGVSRIGQGDLEHKIPVRSQNDLGELASSINTMASDINEMLDAKRQLLLGASHELRSPLTRAKVATGLLEQSNHRASIEEDLAEMEALIAGILESERMKSGHAQLDLASIDVEALVTHVVRDLQSGHIKINCAEDLPDLQADEVRLTLLLRNLISNAVKHQSPSAVSDVEVSACTDERNMLIVVKDNGPGIDPKHLPHVTEPFYRTDASRSRATGGFGLGLHLSKLIAEAHGGTLTINSRTDRSSAAGEGTGTEVIVRLPLESRRAH